MALIVVSVLAMIGVHGCWHDVTNGREQTGTPTVAPAFKQYPMATGGVSRYAISGIAQAAKTIALITLYR
jgi:hypothetical protein